MTDLFSWSDGAALRDCGMAVAEAAQERKSPGWSKRYYAAIERRALAYPTVHRDDVSLDFTEEPHHPNAAGGPWQRARRNGILALSGELRETRDPKKHRHQYPVWLSLIYRGPESPTTER